MYKSGQVAALEALTVSDPWHVGNISDILYISRSIYGWVNQLSTLLRDHPESRRAPDEDLVDQLSCRVNAVNKKDISHLTFYLLN
jgi:hypothetical protein